MKKFKIYLLLILTLLTGCTGSILEEELLSNLSQKGAGGIELDEYIPPGIQFVETTTQGMNQEGFPYLRNNRTFNIKWIIKTCDPVNNPQDAACAGAPTGTAENPDPGFYISRLEYTSGTTWVQIPGATDLGGYNDQVQGYSWSIPISLTDEGDQFRFRLITRNAKLETFTAVSSQFIMDSSAPVIQAGTLTFNGSIDTPLNLKSPGVNIDFNADDTLSPVDSFCLKDSAAIPTAEHSCWIKISSLGLTESKNLQVRNLKRVLGWIGGSFTFYFWVKDKSGNFSRLTNDIGDETIDRRTISYAPGRSILFVKNIAANDDTVSDNPPLEKTVIDVTRPTMYLKWSYTIDQNTTLDLVEPYKIEYSTDAITYQNITNASGTAMLDSEISAGVDQGCQTVGSQDPQSIDKCFVWTPPASLHSMPLYMRIHVRDSAGFVYSISTNPFNQATSLSADGKIQGLRFAAGLSDSLIGASALNTKFDIDISYIRSGGKLVVHEDGRIFVLDETAGVIEISQFDGKARVYVKKATSSVDGYAVETPSLLAGRTEATASNILKISLDYKGRLLILENNRIRQVTDERDAQGNLTGVREVKTIVGCLQSPTSLCYFNSAAKNTAYNAKVPKQYWQNAWIYGNEFSFPNPVDDYSRMYRHFTPMPNGDIYFSINGSPSYISTTTPSSGNSWRGLDFRVYRPDPDPSKPGKILPLSLTGYGVLGEPFKPIAELYPSSMGGITFNPITGNPTTLHMFWQYCPPNTTAQCEYFTSNHNPKTGQSNGTGTHYYSFTFSLKNSLAKGYANSHMVRYFTSRRGELYAYNTNQFELNLGKLNTSTNKFEKVLGTTYNGYCEDGTLATSCPVYLRDAWVTQDNTIFFIDGQQVRMIGADGRVVTLFGRKPADRNGFEATLSTLGRFEAFGKWYDSSNSTDKFIIREHDSQLLREFSLDKNIETIAGNETTNWALAWKTSVSKPGYFVSTNLAKDQMGAWSNYQDMAPPLIVDPNNGEPFVFSPETNRSVMKLIRSGADSGRWMRILGGGSASTPYVNTKGASSCDGKMNTQCRGDSNGYNIMLAYIPPKDVTVNGNPAVRPAQVVTEYNRIFSNIWQQYYMKFVDADSGKQTHFIGNNDLLPSGSDSVHFPNSYSQVSIASTNNMERTLSTTRYEYDENKDALLVARYGGTMIGAISFKTDANENFVEADKYYNVTQISNGTILSFTHTVQEGADVFYFCNNSGRLYRRVVTPTFASEILLPMPTGVTCFGRTIEKLVDTNNGLIKLFFPTTFRGQYMMGEYSVSLDL